MAKSILAVLILLVIVAPLFRGGNTPLASLALQWLAITLLTLSFWSPKDIRLSGLEIGLLLLLLLAPLLYLMPLPAAFVDSLPGRELYVGAEALLSSDTARAWKPVSLNPWPRRHSSRACWSRSPSSSPSVSSMHVPCKGWRSCSSHWPYSRPSSGWCNMVRVRVERSFSRSTAVIVVRPSAPTPTATISPGYWP
ncbi:MAG: hypothetical protein MZV65_07050 [Chromatiales bacterium]|nr:hypothetical protein [Chromatiales bacterium]